MTGQLQDVGPVFAALADPTRLRLVVDLGDHGPRSLIKLAGTTSLTRQQEREDNTFPRSRAPESCTAAALVCSACGSWTPGGSAPPARRSTSLPGAGMRPSNGCVGRSKSRSRNRGPVQRRRRPRRRRRDGRMIHPVPTISISAALQSFSAEIQAAAARHVPTTTTTNIARISGGVHLATTIPRTVTSCSSSWPVTSPFPPTGGWNRLHRTSTRTRSSCRRASTRPRAEPGTVVVMVEKVSTVNTGARVVRTSELRELD